MRIEAKVASCFLALIFGLPWLFAQEMPPGPGSQPPGPVGERATSHRGPGEMRGREFRENERDFHGFRGMYGRRWRHSEFRLMRLVNDPAMREKLGVTDEQAAKIRQQTFDFQKAEVRDRAEVQVRRLELNQLLTAATPDRVAIDQKLEQISAAQLAQKKLEVNYRLDMRAALTSEQRQKLQNLREEFRHPATPRPHMQPPKPQGS